MRFGDKELRAPLVSVPVALATANCADRYQLTIDGLGLDDFDDRKRVELMGIDFDDVDTWKNDSAPPLG